MKARVKATGKLLENVIPIMSVDSKVVMFHEYGTENDYYYYEDLDFSNTIDWEQTRIQAAIAAMQGFIITVEVPIEDIAKKSVKLANALVEELQKKGEQE